MHLADLSRKHPSLLFKEGEKTDDDRKYYKTLPASPPTPFPAQFVTISYPNAPKLQNCLQCCWGVAEEEGLTRGWVVEGR